MSNRNTPENYTPFEKVWVCGNVFQNGNVLLETEGKAVFLIGKSENDGSRIWVNAPRNSDRNPVWVETIIDGRILDHRYKINSSEYGSEVTFNRVPILQYRVQENCLIISLINFHPIGLNIIGGVKSLNVGGQEFTDNSFDGVGVMIGIGPS